MRWIYGRFLQSVFECCRMLSNVVECCRMLSNVILRSWSQYLNKSVAVNCRLYFNLKTRVLLCASLAQN
jgi:hypothetical protein